MSDAIVIDDPLLHPILKPVRKLRHWKQRYDEKAAFVWRKPTTYGGVFFQGGSVIPPNIIESIGRKKLKRFWEAGRIELAEFDEPLVSLPTTPLHGDATEPEEGTDGEASEQTEAETPTETEAVEGDAGECRGDAG